MLAFFLMMLFSGKTTTSVEEQADFDVVQLPTNTVAIPESTTTPFTPSLPTAQSTAVVLEEPTLQPTTQPIQLPCNVSQRFPDKVFRWCGLITFYASRRGIDPDLVAALIVQESGGNPNAYSSAGAVGLMQVMPKDGIAAKFMCPNGPCFGGRPSMAELKDPEFNIKYGTGMLSRLIKKNGNVREALKSYGPANYGYVYADKVLSIYSRLKKK